MPHWPAVPHRRISPDAQGLVGETALPLRELDGILTTPAIHPHATQPAYGSTARVRERRVNETTDNNDVLLSHVRKCASTLLPLGVSEGPLSDNAARDGEDR